jgi:hypothetical protein
MRNEVLPPAGLSTALRAGFAISRGTGEVATGWSRYHEDVLRASTEAGQALLRARTLKDIVRGGIARLISITVCRSNLSMEKILLAAGAALAAIVTVGPAQAQLANTGCTSISCLQTQANVTNPITTTTTTTTTLAEQINAALQGSLLNAGMLSETTTNTGISAMGGVGSSSNSASLSNNDSIAGTPTKASVGGPVTMTSSMIGQGVLETSQNTGANAVQQNSLALTSVGAGGILAITAPVR